MYTYKDITYSVEETLGQTMLAALQAQNLPDVAIANALSALGKIINKGARDAEKVVSDKNKQIIAQWSQARATVIQEARDDVFALERELERQIVAIRANKQKTLDGLLSDCQTYVKESGGELPQGAKMRVTQDGTPYLSTSGTGLPGARGGSVAGRKVSIGFKDTATGIEYSTAGSICNALGFAATSNDSATGKPHYQKAPDLLAAIDAGAVERMYKDASAE